MKGPSVTSWSIDRVSMTITAAARLTRGVHLIAGALHMIFIFICSGYTPRPANWAGPIAAPMGCRRYSSLSYTFVVGTLCEHAACVNTYRASRLVDDRMPISAVPNTRQKQRTACPCFHQKQGNCIPCSANKGPC